MQTTEVLVHPGWGDSGPDHWQSIWISHPERFPGARLQRVIQREWTDISLEEWLETLNRTIDHTVALSGGSVFYIGHSSSSILLPHWAARYPEKARASIQAAMLVAPTDVEDPPSRRARPGFTDHRMPPEVQRLRPIPRTRLPFPTLVVASEDDPYTELARAQQFAMWWDAKLVNIGKGGHINTAAGFGEWPQGEELLHGLLQRFPVKTPDMSISR